MECDAFIVLARENTVLLTSVSGDSLGLSLREPGGFVHRCM